MTDEHDIDPRYREALDTLPRRMPPRRDLWPDIEARLGKQEAPERQRVHRWRWQALAASVVVAFAAGLLLGRQVDTPVAPGLSPSDLNEMALSVSREATEREYQAAFQAFTPVGVEPEWMESGAVQGLEHSWAELQEAEAALLQALEDHPDNRFLSEKLLNLRAQQLEFMRQLHMLDQNSRRKT